MAELIAGMIEPEQAESNTNTLLQRGFLAAAGEKLPDDMYSRIERGSAVRGRDSAVVHPHATLSMNTYFGRLPASYWQRWTQVTEVELAAVVSGTGRISVIASDNAGVPRTIAAYVVSAAEPVEVRLPARIDRFLDGGALWMEAAGGAEPLHVGTVRWLGPAPETTRQCAVVLCTHNRADACLDTLERMVADAEAMAFVDAVYVVDQGTESVAAKQRFAEVERALGPKLHYRTQANLGGAGGFTRGLVEALDANEGRSTNVVFMDDDIILEPDTLIRVRAFADRTVSPVLVGGQMLCALHPQQLLADAEDFDPERLRVGLPITRSLARANMLRKRQEERVDAPYNAWWTCLIPGEVVRRIGHPLPMFFQWDDVEFGIRAREHGFATVTLPGAGVWHSDSDWKNWDDWARYFHFRNGLLVSALHSPFDTGKICRNLGWDIWCCLVSMQYGLAATMIKAVEDFLRGPEAFADGGVEVAVEVHKFRAEYSETAVQPAAEVPQLDTGTPLVRDPGTPSMPLAILLKRTLWQLLNRTRPGAAIPADDAHWWHMALFRSAVVTDPSQEGVRVYRMDRELARRLAWRAARMLWRLRREGGAVRREYVTALPEMASRANWQRLFDGPR